MTTHTPTPQHTAPKGLPAARKIAAQHPEEWDWDFYWAYVIRNSRRREAIYTTLLNLTPTGTVHRKMYQKRDRESTMRMRLFREPEITPGALSLLANDAHLPVMYAVATSDRADRATLENIINRCETFLLNENITGIHHASEDGTIVLAAMKAAHTTLARHHTRT